MILIPPPPSVNPDLSLFLLNKQLRAESPERAVEVVMSRLPGDPGPAPEAALGARRWEGGGGRLRPGKGVWGRELPAGSPSLGPL